MSSISRVATSAAASASSGWRRACWRCSLYLAAHAQRVISRDDLIASVWGHLEAASDDSVNVAISDLREALGDTRRPQRIFETVPRRGHRHLGTGVEFAALSPPRHGPPDAAPADTETNRATAAEASPAAASAATIAAVQASPPKLRRLAALCLIAAVAAVVIVAVATLLVREPAQGTLAPVPNASAERTVPATAVAVRPFTDLRRFA